MSRVVTLSTVALADFDSIYDHIAKQNPIAASTALRKLDAAIQHLTVHPRLGKTYRHGRRQLRVLVHADYLVFYRAMTTTIHIVRVIHGRRHVPDIFDEL